MFEQRNDYIRKIKKAEKTPAYFNLYWHLNCNVNANKVLVMFGFYLNFLICDEFLLFGEFFYHLKKLSGQEKLKSSAL